MKRFLLTFVTSVVFSSIFILYQVFIVPLTEPLPAPTGEVVTPVAGYQPPILVDTAQEFFPDVEWLTSGAIKTLQSKNLAFYTQHYVRDETSGKKVEMSPIAILWRDARRPDAKPFRLIADSGVVEFENRFFDSALHLSSTKPGRMIWASLNGLVHIDGPDGLEIDGEQFVFSEQSGQLYSDFGLSFSYGPSADDETRIKGTADQINMSLLAADDAPLGDDMPRIGGISMLTLRQNVDLEAEYIVSKERHTARIQCTGPFEYDFLKRNATLTNRVVITDLLHDPRAMLKDSLECERLSLQFVESEPQQTPEDPTKALFDNLQLASIQADGSTGGLGGRTSNVRLISQKHKTTATMQRMFYDVLQKVVSLADPQAVDAIREGARFSCPQIRIAHTDENELARLDCFGPGNLIVAHEKLGDSKAVAWWGEGVAVIPDPQSGLFVVNLREETQVILPGVVTEANERRYEMGLAADALRLWVDLADFDVEGEFLNQKLPLHRVEATGRVAMVSRDVVIERSDRIHVNVQPGTVNVTDTYTADDSKVIGARFEDSSEGKSKPARRLQQPIRVGVDAIELDLIHDAVTGKVGLQRVDGTGNVELKYDLDKPETEEKFGAVDEPVVLKGDRIYTGDAFATQQQVTLVGVSDEYGSVTVPAEMSFGPTRIKGANLNFSRSQNTVTIDGPGAFQIPVTKDLDGNELETPSALRIVWQEGMKFDGQTIKFLDNVRCSLIGQDDNLSKFECDEFVVRLTRPIRFDEGDNSEEKVEVESIAARHRVQFTFVERDHNRLLSIRKGELDEFKLNQVSGEFEGRGPGEVHSWSIGDQLKLTPTEQTSANNPIKEDGPADWRHSRLAFSGSFSGNMQSKTANFDSQRIQVVSGPVDQALVKFPVEDIPKVNDAVRLECRTLRIFQREFNKVGYWELFAKQVNELEGRMFFAIADELSFDERLGRFMLRGIGKDATLYFQEQPGSAVSPSFHRYIEFIPKERRISVDGSSGVGG